MIWTTNVSINTCVKVYATPSFKPLWISTNELKTDVAHTLHYWANILVKVHGERWFWTPMNTFPRQLGLARRLPILLQTLPINIERTTTTSLMPRSMSKLQFPTNIQEFPTCSQAFILLTLNSAQRSRLFKTLRTTL